MALDSSITDLITQKNIAKGVTVTIWDWNGVLVNSSLFSDKLISYSFQLSQKFTASTATLTFLNENGLFSPDNSASPIKRGYVVKIQEFFSNQVGGATPFNRFYGTITQLNPTKNSQGNTIEVTCYDPLLRLQETDIEKVFESADKEFIENDVLSENPLPEPRERFSQVFDGDYAAWATLPPPTISITVKGSSEVAQARTDGFEINYKSGQVILNQVLNIDDFDVKATYYHYQRGLQAEDIIKSILLEPDSFGGVLFTSSDVQSTLLEETGASTDPLSPVVTPVNFTSFLSVKKSPTDLVLYVPRYDSWKFITSHTLKIGEVELSWNGKQDVVVSGVQLTKLLNVTGIHTDTLIRGQTISVFYDPIEDQKTRIWRTSFNNISSTISLSDFNMGGGPTAATFDARSGTLILNTPVLPSTAIVLNKNYTFSTLQATGIEIPYLRLSRAEHPNRLEAIKREILPLLPPNYCIFTKGTSRVWGSFLYQKSAEDFQLKLNKQLQYIADQDVFTRVYLKGQNDNPHNVMLDDSTRFLGINEYDLSFNAFATDQPLRVPEEGEYSRSYYPFSIYLMKDQRYSWVTDQMMIYPNWLENGVLKTPSIKIDGVPIGHEKIRKSRIPLVMREETRQEKNKIGVLFGEIDFFGTHQTSAGFTLRIPHRAILPPVDVDTSIVFYDRDGRVVEFLNSPLVIMKSDTTNMDVHSFDLLQINAFSPNGRKIGRLYQGEDDSYISDMPFSQSFLSTFGFISYSVMLPESINGKPSWYLSGGHFWIHRDLLAYQVFGNMAEIPDGVDYIKAGYSSDGSGTFIAMYSQVTSSFRYRSILAKFDEPNSLKDGDVNTQAQLAFFNQTAISGQSAFIVDFGRKVKVQAMDLIAGKFYPYKRFDKGFALDCNFALTLQSSNSVSTAVLVDSVGPTSTFMRVRSTAGFPNSGTAFIGDDSFTYTSKNDYTFFGLSGLTEQHQVAGIYVQDPATGATHYEMRCELILSERFANISQEASGISLKSGDTVTLDKQQLGETLECRMIRVVVDHVDPVEYARRVFAYPVALASFNVYEDIEFESNAKLTPTTSLTVGFSTPPNVLHVADTSLFPTSGTAYLGTQRFLYTGKTSTTFTGVTGLTQGHFVGAYITQQNVWDDISTFVRDPRNLLKEMGDKVFKETDTDRKVTTQEKLNKRAKDLLAEFYKNHTKVRVENVFAPYVQVGQTVRIQDSYGTFEIDRNYFVESITSNNGNYSLELAYYP